MLASRFSFFGGGGSRKVDNQVERDQSELNPTLKLQTDTDVYRPGDTVYITIEICNPLASGNTGSTVQSLLIERLGFEIKGIEKLDTQWFATQKPLAGTKQRRGEHVFLDCSTAAMVSNQIVPSGSAKTYVVRAVLPSIIPPSYKGATVRYLYYIKSTLSVRWLIVENGHFGEESVKDLTEVEARVPLQVWVTQKRNGLVMEDGQSDGIVPSTTFQADIYWKEMDGDSEWTRVSEMYDGVEEGYDSSRDEMSSVSSYNPSKENLYKTFGSSLSLQSSAARSSIRDGPYPDADRMSLSSNAGLPRLSVAEVLYDSTADMSSAVLSPSQQQTPRRSLALDDTTGVSSAPSPRPTESVASEGFIRGRSYNIRMDDQVLLRFSPKNSESTYYFSDMIGGTLTFFHEEGARRCLEVSVTLETSETINRRFVHPSRRNSPTITKVQSDHHEVVADLVQTSFLFSIPMDGPMSFSTPHVSVQWSLRFEFFTTPKNVDWTRYEHPLLIEGRDKSEWVLPITVHAPPPGTPAARTRNEKPFSLEPLWVDTACNSYDELCVTKQCPAPPPFQ
ncbi:Reduced growth phenotype protein 1 [Corchorus capsularis]|uniref:Reduced growth phenotype protein 1 n=1 Tax=Corchorus capsularis TaxID=210143 RepID=A0A1R3GPY3_COCAP|nr:Reduced growth phenotype protein 1 [Corchorus capsularis]